MGRVKRPLATFIVSTALLAGLAAATLFLFARSPAFGQSTLGVPCESLPPESPGSCSGEPLDWKREAPMRVVALLPTGRQGRPYRAPIIRGGLKGYDYSVETPLPPGLALTSGGFLEGTPTEAKGFHVRIVAHDSSTPPRHISAEWRIRILPPLGPRPEPPPPPPGPSQPAQPPIRTITVYALDKARLAAVDQDYPSIPLPAPPALKQPTLAAASQTPARRYPTTLNTAKVSTTATTNAALPSSTVTNAAIPSASAETAPVKPSAQLLVLKDVEYPDRSVFRSAVRDALAGPGAGPRPELDGLVDDAVKRAERRYNYADAPPLHWSSAAGCGCVAPLPQGVARTIYGFFPFWRASPDSPPINFSLFDRIGYLGVQGSETGVWLEPGGQTLHQPGFSDFAWAAKAHGVKLDLVLQRANWQDLAQDQTKNYGDAVAGADSAVEFLKYQLNDGARWYRFPLLGIWKSPKFVFDGLTIMFTEPSYTDESSKQSYESYYKSFVLRALDRMKELHRNVSLNLVMTDDVFCQVALKGLGGTGDPCGSGQFSQANLHNYLIQSQDSSDGAHRSRVSVKYIILLHAPTSPAKKDLRAAVDTLADIGDKTMTRGADRVLLLRSIIPVSFTPPPSPSTLTSPQQLYDDLDYFQNNFGGAGLWQVPAPKSAVDYVRKNLVLPGYKATTIEKLPGLKTIPWFCSTLARLLLQALTAAIVIGFVVIAFADLSDSQIRLVRIATIAVAFLAFVLGLVLLERDPVLDALSRDNGILVFVLLVALILAGVLLLRPKVRDP